MDKIREKLVEILLEPCVGLHPASELADYLIEQGVTVQKHGLWIYKPYDGYEELWLYHCSECNALSATVKNYCYNCGAKMDLEG